MSTASGASPFPPGCGGAGEAFDSSVLYQNAEVEPSVAVNPTNPDNIVGFWQQDRWSDGGAHGLRAGVSLDGGQTWSHSAPRFSRCAGGTGDAGGYHRSSDPWVSFSPNGVVHAISISFDNDTPRNAVLASRSADGGQTWSDPAVLRFDNPRAGEQLQRQGVDHRGSRRLAARLCGVGPPGLAQPALERQGVRAVGELPRADVVCAQHG